MKDFGAFTISWVSNATRSVFMVSPSIRAAHAELAGTRLWRIFYLKGQYSQDQYRVKALQIRHMGNYILYNAFLFFSRRAGLPCERTPCCAGRWLMLARSNAVGLSGPREGPVNSPASAPEGRFQPKFAAPPHHPRKPGKSRLQITLQQIRCIETRCQSCSSSSNAFVSFKTGASNPSVNQPLIGARRLRASPRLSCLHQRRARLIIARSSKSFALWSFATVGASRAGSSIRR